MGNSTDSSASTAGSIRTSSTPSSAERLAELHEQIADGVAALVDSNAWRAMLDTAAKFHTYSLSNVLLIALQAPQATRVAGFRTWQSLGRQVRKGECGIGILAPCTYRPKASTAATDSAREQAKDERGGAAAHGLDASGYTFAYVAGWAGGDLTRVRQAAETVNKAARTILAGCSSANGADSGRRPSQESP